jgi:hypothetical protein
VAARRIVALVVAVDGLRVEVPGSKMARLLVHAEVALVVVVDLPAWVAGVVVWEPCLEAVVDAGRTANAS